MRPCRRASLIASISLARQLVQLTGWNERRSITGFPGFSNGIIFASSSGSGHHSYSHTSSNNQSSIPAMTLTNVLAVSMYVVQSGPGAAFFYVSFRENCISLKQRRGFSTSSISRWMTRMKLLHSLMDVAAAGLASALQHSSAIMI